jgi:membrane protein YqaA with SNARE-associated domain
LLQKLTAALVAYGPWGILALAFIDSAGIPVSAGMDALIILVAVEAPSRAYFGASMAVLGSVAGNLVLFLIARRGGRRYLERNTEPGKFRRWFEQYGLATVFIPALVPIPLPLKVFVISAGALGTTRQSFVSVILLARVIRYFGEAYLGATLGKRSLGYVQANAWLMVGIAAALAVILFLILRIAGRPGRKIPTQ